MSPFSWQCQNLCLLSLTFIIDWRVVTPFQCKCWTEIAPFPVKLFHAKYKFDITDFIFQAWRRRNTWPRSDTVTLRSKSWSEKFSASNAPKSATLPPHSPYTTTVTCSHAKRPQLPQTGALFTIQELAQAFLLPTWNWSVTTLFFRTCVFSCRFFDSEHICSCTAMAWLRPIVMGKANSTTAPPATGSTLRCTSTTWLTTAEETPSTKASRTKWS